MCIKSHKIPASIYGNNLRSGIRKKDAESIDPKRWHSTMCMRSCRSKTLIGLSKSPGLTPFELPRPGNGRTWKNQTSIVV